MLRCLRNCRKEVANIVLWMPLVWRDSDFDYAPMLRMMPFKLCKMADAQEQYGYAVNRERSACQMRLCAELCRRLYRGNRDNYEELFASNAGRRLVGPEYAGRYRGQKLALAGLRMERDVEQLSYMLRRHLLKWWD